MIAWARYPSDGTTVLVTGGGSGIGRAIARGFLEQGASVVLTGRHAEPLHETIASFPDDRAAAVAGDMATQTGVSAAVALDLGRDGVRVNAIAPAFTATRQTQKRLDDPAFWSALRDRLALDRAAEPEDVARAALFLASPDAAYITGVVLPVDGGTTASVGTPRPITG